MDPRQYRQQVEQSLERARSAGASEERASDPAAPQDLAAMLAQARDGAADPALRARTLLRAGRVGADDDAPITLALELLGDGAEPAAVRHAALDLLQLAAVTSARFAARRPEYLATLRAIIETPDLPLRERALGVLARERDALAQRRLLEGLADPAKALVAPEVAIPLLGYDLEAGSFPVLRQVAASDAVSLPARVEAARVLAADPGSRDLIEQLARDRAEPVALRQVAAAGLHANDPAAARRLARELVLATDESAEVQATGLTALAFPAERAERAAGREAAVADGGPGDEGDAELRERVEELAQQTTSEELRKSARAYLARVKPR